MNMKALIAGCASAALLAGASSASAADIIRHHVEPRLPIIMPPVFGWTGFYAGAELGGSWVKTQTKGIMKQGTEVIKGLFKDPAAFVGGLYAGYDFDMGNNVVAGIDTDWVWAFNKKDKKDEQNFREKSVGATRARLGYACDRFLPYIAAGVAYGDIEVKQGDKKEAKWHAGWTVGGGLEYAITDNVLVRGEYRYNDFGKLDYLASGVKDAKVAYKTNDVRVGVAYKF